MTYVRSLVLHVLLAIRWAISRRRSRLVLDPHEFEDTVARLQTGRSYAHMSETSRWVSVIRDRTRLIQFGFVSTALERLESKHRLASSAQTRRLAAWYLGMWHASGLGDPAQAHAYLDAGVGHKRALTRLTQPALVRAHAWSLLGDGEQAERVLAHHRGPHVDLARQSDSPIASLNSALRWYGRTPLTPGPELPWPPRSDHPAAPAHRAGDPVVSVLVAAHNDEPLMGGALGSLLAQTYPNLEIIVADAGSDDATVAAAHAIADPRIRVLHVDASRGISGARTAALHAATGTYVTSHDPHQWAHPERIALQVDYLRRHPQVKGALCQGATLSGDDTWVMDPVLPRYVTIPVSSLMLSREDALTHLGAWDLVKDGAHAEWHARASALWGPSALATVPTGPVLLARRTASHGGPLDDLDELYATRRVAGRAREYSQQFRRYHGVAPTLHYPPDSRQRAFPAPASLVTTTERLRHVDVVLASDFGLIGGSTKSNVAELEAMTQAGLTVGVMPMFRPDGPRRAMLRDIQALIDGRQIHLLSSHDTVSTDLLEVRYPPVLREPQELLPTIRPRHVRIIVNQPPLSHYGPDAVVRYEIGRADAYARELWGVTPQWCPIGPQVRATLHDHHADAIAHIDLAPDDWVNIIDVGQWQRAHPRERDGIIRIGRHARDHAVKWLSDPDQLAAAYPSDAPFEVHVLGGADTPRAVLGQPTPSWTVHPFGAMEPREFLATIDVFVYFTHPEWVESFGRVVLEAMAVGVPAILPPEYEPLFGSAALYGTPSQVRQMATDLMDDEDRYLARVEAAAAYVEHHYGYSQHIARIAPLLSRPLASGSS